MGKNYKNGFSLVEVLVVIGIIALLLALILPGVLSSRLASNESSAISDMRTIQVATQTYWSVSNNLPTTLNQLYSGNYIDAGLGGCGSTCCSRNGYTYCAEGTGVVDDFYVYALPQTPNVSGTRSFCFVSDGVIRTDSSGAAPASKTACNSLNPL